MLIKHFVAYLPIDEIESPPPPPPHNSPVSGLRVIISSWLLNMVFPQTFIVIFPEI